MLKNNLKAINKEAEAVISYLKERNIEVKDLELKLNKLEVLTPNRGNITLSSKRITTNVYFNGGGYYTPLYSGYTERIDRYFICIEKSYLEYVEYKVHEFLHFISTNDLVKRKIKCGIAPINNKSEGLEAINEAITDFYTFRICGKAFDEKFYRLYAESPDESSYYYPTLLINLLVFGSGYKKDKLLKAYINNDSKYVFDEIKECFGLSKQEAIKLFGDLIKFYYNRKDKGLKKSLQKDIKKVVNFYYNNLSKDMQNKYKSFEKIYLSKFKLLYK